jgi:predicted metal-dependent hydrolase
VSTDVSQIRLGDVAVDVVLKDIKNVHLSVHPPTGRVRIAAPKRMRLDTIRVFAISKLAWIRQQQAKLRAQERETPRQYVERESHYVWGRRHLMTVVEREGPPSIEIKHTRFVLGVPPRTSEEKRRALVEQWYREELKEAVPPLLARWEQRLGVHVQRFFVQRMKTRWGSCNAKTRSIRLNSELAKKPLPCLEYLVVHEMVHLIEPTHNARFVAVMDRVMPHWRELRQQLNRLPIRHDKWTY